MDTDQADIDLIERYIQGQLSPAEVMHFEFRLDDDREFGRKFRLRKTFPELMHEEGYIEPAKTSAGTSAQKTERGSFNFIKPRFLAWVAAVVIMTGVVIFLINMKTIFPGERSATPGPNDRNDPRIISQVKQPSQVVYPAAAEPSVKKPIELEAPADGDTLNRIGDILFRWKLETDTFTNIYIFTEINDELVWWRGIKPGIREHKVPAIYFQPGRFYWYVGTRDVKRTFIVNE